MSPSLSPPLSPRTPPPDIDSSLALIIDTNTADPPPPYPASPRRPRRTRRHHHQGDSEHDHRHTCSDSGEDELNERTPLLGHISSRPPGGLRPRALSQSSAAPSAVSGTPSLAQALMLGLDSDIEDDSEHNEQDAVTERGAFEQEAAGPNPAGRRPRRGRALVYFKPLARRAYWAALFHLLVLNFPYALLAAIYCFVVTLVGTTLLVALPLGAVVCFFDLLGARALARGEVLLQTTFHGPLGYELVAPLPPIFTRTRVLTSAEAEEGSIGPQRERSFYKNAYAMFTDPTSYHALFYFIVIKPSITLLLSLFLLVVVPVSFALVLPAPATLRLVRRLGIWQANIAVDGLYMGGTG